MWRFGELYIQNFSSESHLSAVSPSVRMRQLGTGRILVKFHFGNFIKVCRRNASCKFEEKYGTFYVKA